MRAEEAQLSACDDPASAQDICTPRVRRRLLAIGRPAPSADADLTALAARRLATRLVDAADLEAGLSYLEASDVSCVVLDATGARTDIRDAVTRLSAVRDHTPIVVLGDDEDPLAGVAAVQAGAQDYVIAARADEATLERSIRHAIDRNRTRAEIAQMALRDQMTGAANRTLLTDRLEQALGRGRRTGGASAVLFVDIDSFKLINDSLGHDAGDRVLRCAAERIGAAIRPTDTLARFGGDEFTVLCEGVESGQEALGLAQTIEAALRAPLEVGNTEIVLRASVGVAMDVAGEHGCDDLLHEAGEAMREAKRRGGARAQLWLPKQRAPGNAIQLEADLRRAIPNGLRAVYQPQVGLADGALIGIEALVRWQHPQRGRVSPGDFIPVAERSGLIFPIGRWMLGTACDEAMRLAGPTGAPAGVSVNVSARQVADPALVTDVQAALAASGLPAERLQLELTESVLMDDLDAGVKLLRRLKELGVTLALDDFGTGYSSLSYLQRLPFDTIKIDRSFVAGLPDCREDLAIVSAVISFARALGMTVLAEGVETEAHVQALLDLGCERAQGFHFHRPLEPEQLRELFTAAQAPAPGSGSAVPCTRTI